MPGETGELTQEENCLLGHVDTSYWRSGCLRLIAPLNPLHIVAGSIIERGLSRLLEQTTPLGEQSPSVPVLRPQIRGALPSSLVCQTWTSLLVSEGFTQPFL